MKRVLLIEDEPWLAELFATSLQEAGFDVVPAMHAEAAMARVDESLPDCIVADMLLTGSTVLTLLHELQSHPDTKAIPVILCTNTAEQLDAHAMRVYGVVRILDKTTMEPSDIVAAVRSVTL